MSLTTQSMWLKFLVRFWLFNFQPQFLLCFRLLDP